MEEQKNFTPELLKQLWSEPGTEKMHPVAQEWIERFLGGYAKHMETLGEISDKDYQYEMQMYCSIQAVGLIKTFSEHGWMFVGGT